MLVQHKLYQFMIPGLMLHGSHDKLRPQYVGPKDANDTIGRYVVLLPEEKADSCQHGSK